MGTSRSSILADVVGTTTAVSDAVPIASTNGQTETTNAVRVLVIAVAARDNEQVGVASRHSPRVHNRMSF